MCKCLKTNNRNGETVEKIVKDRLSLAEILALLQYATVSLYERPCLRWMRILLTGCIIVQILVWFPLGSPFSPPVLGQQCLRAPLMRCGWHRATKHSYEKFPKEVLLRSWRLRTSSRTWSCRTCCRTSCLSVSWTIPILSNFSPFNRSNARPVMAWWENASTYVR